MGERLEDDRGWMEDDRGRYREYKDWIGFGLRGGEIEGGLRGLGEGICEVCIY